MWAAGSVCTAGGPEGSITAGQFLNRRPYSNPAAVPAASRYEPAAAPAAL